MLTIRVTTRTKTVRMTVEQVEFIRTCPYCLDEFATINPDQIYCKRSHQVSACQVRHFDRGIPQWLASASTLGMSRAMPCRL